MATLINKKVFHYIFWAFSFYMATYFAYVNFGDSSKTWDLIWFINENVLIINLLIAISRIINEVRLRVFSHIAIAFKSLICLINTLTFLNIAISEFWAEFVISFYWIIALIFYLYVSRKRLPKQKMD